MAPFLWDDCTISSWPPKQSRNHRLRCVNHAICQPIFVWETSEFILIHPLSQKNTGKFTRESEIFGFLLDLVTWNLQAVKTLHIVKILWQILRCVVFTLGRRYRFYNYHSVTSAGRKQSSIDMYRLWLRIRVLRKWLLCHPINNLT